MEALLLRAAALLGCLPRDRVGWKAWLQSQFTPTREAFLIQGPICAFITFWFETEAANLSLIQWLVIRVVYNSTRFGFSERIAVANKFVRNYMMMILPARWLRVLPDSLVYTAIHTPLYALSALVAGGELNQILIIIPFYCVENLLMAGPLYSLILAKLVEPRRAQRK